MIRNNKQDNNIDINNNINNNNNNNKKYQQQQQKQMLQEVPIKIYFPELNPKGTATKIRTTTTILTTLWFEHKDIQIQR